MISSDPRRLLPLKFSSTPSTSLAIERKASEIVDSSSTRPKKKKKGHITLNTRSDNNNNNNDNFPSFCHEFLRQTPRQSIFIESLEGRRRCKRFLPPSSPVHSPSFLPFSFSFPPIDLAHSSRSEALTRAQRTLVNAALQDLTVTWRG